ncbi:hypothetical protein [Neptuniibacter sp. QD37_11]|uniref:hypothetical protein n=1 Tax=Neptuniibacter sp. QD37_11 TaxID=3398209 RepID=UPI0039F4AC3E
MFSLIISIIAIALVVALAGATLYYGGAAFRDNGIKTTVAEYKNESAQIVGAINAYRVQQGGLPSDFTLQDLVPEYLKSVPEGEWDIQDNRVIRTGVEELVCYRANEVMGFEFDPAEEGVDALASDSSKGIPQCSKSDLPFDVPCCSSATT